MDGGIAGLPRHLDGKTPVAADIGADECGYQQQEAANGGTGAASGLSDHGEYSLKTS